MDNFAFNQNDELFVSSYSEGYVLKVKGNEIEEILPGGISHAGGLASIDGDIVVADIQSVKAYYFETGKESWNYKNTFRVSPMGANTSVSTFNNNLILTSWLDGHVKIMRPDTGEIIGSLENLLIPVSATPFKNKVAVTLHGNGSVTLFDMQSKSSEVLADGFMSPTHIINYNEQLLVSDKLAGQVISIDEAGNKSVIIDGLNSPEGIAIKDNAIYVFEGDTGEILKVTDQSKELVATVLPGSQPQSKDQPPSMVFNGLIIEDDLLYISGEMERSIFRIKI